MQVQITLNCLFHYGYLPSVGKWFSQISHIPHKTFSEDWRQAKLPYGSFRSDTAFTRKNGEEGFFPCIPLYISGFPPVYLYKHRTLSITLQQSLGVISILPQLIVEAANIFLKVAAVVDGKPNNLWGCIELWNWWDSKPLSVWFVKGNA